jgi:uncharacterized protein (TIGR03435 family)
VDPNLGSPLYAGSLPYERNSKSVVFQTIIRATTFPSEGTICEGGAGMGAFGPEFGFSAVAYPVRDLLPSAYGVLPDRVIVEGELPSGSYDVAVQAPMKLADQFVSLLQRTIEETFNLSSRRETREMDVYVLTVADPSNGGMAPTKTPKSSGWSHDQVGISAINVSVGGLASTLELQLKQPVVDETNLTGRYDYRLDMDWKASEETVVAAVRKQLGLALTPAKRKVEVVVVDASAAVSPATMPSR